MIMPASMSTTAPAVDPVEVFELRAWARAVLFFIGEIDLQQAIDPLQAAAERDGLIASIGQDAVQAIIAENFLVPQ
jgi:hypothetical protein